MNISYISLQSAEEVTSAGNFGGAMRYFLNSYGSSDSLVTSTMNSDQIIVQIGQVDVNNIKTVKTFGK